jgi:hypothetical protein
MSVRSCYPGGHYLLSDADDGRTNCCAVQEGAGHEAGSIQGT